MGTILFFSSCVSLAVVFCIFVELLERYTKSRGLSTFLCMFILPVFAMGLPLYVGFLLGY